VTDEVLLQEGRRVIADEAAALLALRDGLDHRFCLAARAIAACSGRIVTTAVGKSGAVARKFASTLSSLGCSAMFIHPIEGMHGDLGMIQPGDVVIAISHSGSSDELVAFLAAAHRRCKPLTIAIVSRGGGKVDATAEIVLDTGVTDEACALGLAPTSSSTAALALGDALAVAASRVKGFQATDFAGLHPAGALGQKLQVPVEQLMRSDFPRIGGDRPMREAVQAMTAGAMGLVIVDDAPSRRVGIISDGDVRRAMSMPGLDDRRASELMSVPVRSVPVGTLSMDALVEMERERVTALLVLDQADNPVGVVHIHDILRYGFNLVHPPAKAARLQSTATNP
jgi:arabinose-5-phosphate isomerase